MREDPHRLVFFDECATKTIITQVFRVVVQERRSSEGSVSS